MWIVGYREAYERTKLGRTYHSDPAPELEAAQLVLFIAEHFLVRRECNDLACAFHPERLREGRDRVKAFPAIAKRDGVR